MGVVYPNSQPPAQECVFQLEQGRMSTATERADELVALLPALSRLSHRSVQRF
jgi:hypothetical protein